MGIKAGAPLVGAVLLVMALPACSTGEQGSPDAVVEAAYAAISEGEFTKACSFVEEQAKQALAQFGSSCEVAMAKEYPAEKRKKMRDVEVRMDDIDTSADVIEIPEEAVTFDGEPSTDGDTMVVKRDDKWWITFGG